MRLFIAIDLDGPIKEALVRAQESLRTHNRVVRWVTREQMHLTLVFLGEVHDGQVAEVCNGAKLVADRTSPFEMTVIGSGCFPPRGRVRVVWVGIEEPTGALAQCQAGAADAMESLGFPREDRAFVPHLTLGRVRDDTSQGALRDAVAALRWNPLQQSAGALRVMQSRLAPSGAHYTVVAEFPLKHAPSTTDSP